MPKNPKKIANQDMNCCGEKLVLNRTDVATIQGDPDNGSVVGGVSPCGNYVLYNVVNYTPNQLAAEMYQVNQATGKLTALASSKVFADTGYDSAGVIADYKFRLFVETEELTLAGPGTTLNPLATIMVPLQVKTYTFNTITNSFVLKNVNSNAIPGGVLNCNGTGTGPIGTGLNGCGAPTGSANVFITDDLRYIVIGYNTFIPGANWNKSTVPNSCTDFTVDARIIVLDANTLLPTGAPYIVASSTSLPVLSGYCVYHLCNKHDKHDKHHKHGKCGCDKHHNATNYINVTLGYGVINPTNSSLESLSGPFSLIVLKIDPISKLPVLVTSDTLPQFANAAAAFDPLDCCLQETNILVTGRAAITPSTVSLFTSTTGSASTLPGNGKDDKNLFIYKFDGHRLNLIVKEKFETRLVAGTGPQVWHPDGRTFGVHTCEGGPFDMSPVVGQLQFYRLCEIQRKQHHHDNDSSSDSNDSNDFSDSYSSDRYDDHYYGNQYAIEPIGKLYETLPNTQGGAFSPNGKFYFQTGTLGDTGDVRQSVNATTTGPCANCPICPVYTDILNNCTVIGPYTVNPAYFGTYNISVSQVDSTLKAYKCQDKCQDKHHDKCHDKCKCNKCHKKKRCNKCHKKKCIC